MSSELGSKNLEDKFLEIFFTTTQFTKRKVGITQFKQQETESLYNFWERFKLLLRICPDHNMNQRATQIERKLKISSLEETLDQFMLTT